MYGAGRRPSGRLHPTLQNQIYNERITHPGAWNKVVVVVRLARSVGAIERRRSSDEPLAGLSAVLCRFSADGVRWVPAS
jgi:hypothetical protein